MSTEQKPEAIRLAEKLRDVIHLLDCDFADDIDTNDLKLAAMELESLHARVQELEAKEAKPAAPVVLPEPVGWIDKSALEWIGSRDRGTDAYSTAYLHKSQCAEAGEPIYTEQQMRALLAGVSAPAALAVERGEVLVTVSGFTGSGKSAIAGEIEIMCRALGLQVEWPDSDSEKHMTHADWIAALEQYKPRVRIVECNVPHSVVKGQDK